MRNQTNPWTAWDYAIAVILGALVICAAVAAVASDLIPLLEVFR